MTLEAKREYARKAWRLRGKEKRELKYRRARLERAFRAAYQRRDEDRLSFRLAVGTLQWRLARTMRGRLIRALRRRYEKVYRGQYKTAQCRELIGCSLDELRIHLEKQFQPGMTWENWSFRGWHIDHKKPIAAFDLTDPTQEKAAFHYTNLQPLWAKVNLQKSAK